MLEENAVVLACEGKHATLEIERRTACGLCGQKRGCGNATWGKLLGHHKHGFVAENTVNAKVGDSVIVGIEERAVLNTTLYLYVIPLVAMLVGTVLANYLFSNQFYVMLGAMLGLLLGFMWVKGYLIGHDQTGVAYSKKYQTKILRFAEPVPDYKKGLENCSSAQTIAFKEHK
ncbi:MAG TPA: SoxR reducing system RseC family protein [Methylophilaceae bacterium]|nr:SoxR reducing system RseC family protein [Methylophilaceae bacterium]HQC28367.1 SoxR reducing system RseC family protein [Methylotenera sp.]